MKKITLITTTIILLGGFLTSCSKEEGCTDPAATNYNETAEKDDGSCLYPSTDTNQESQITSTSLTVNFTHNFDGVPVYQTNFNQFNYVTLDGDTLSISKLRYLISRLTLYKANGESVQLKDYQLVDLSVNGSMSFSVSGVNFGAYSAVGFTWGFDTIDNQGNYPDLNIVNWNWPAMIGGGYHFMQMEGQFLDNGNPSPYAYHNGTASNGGNFEANHAFITLPGIALNEQYASLEIRMNIAEWYKNPYTWDLNVYNSTLMPNYTAQKLMHDQVYSVFSLGGLFQK